MTTAFMILKSRRFSCVMVVAARPQLSDTLTSFELHTSQICSLQIQPTSNSSDITRGKLSDFIRLLPEPQKAWHSFFAHLFCLFFHQTRSQWWRSGQRWRGPSVWPAALPWSGRQVFSVDLSIWSVWASTGRERAKGPPPYTPGSRWHHGDTSKHTHS